MLLPCSGAGTADWGIVHGPAAQSGGSYCRIAGNAVARRILCGALPILASLGAVWVLHNLLL